MYRCSVNTKWPGHVGGTRRISWNDQTFSYTYVDEDCVAIIHVNINGMKGTHITRLTISVNRRSRIYQACALPPLQTSARLRVDGKLTSRRFHSGWERSSSVNKQTTMVCKYIT
jgi:hypothetical protein